ncbi:MAG: GNAT family N-acetyltransferase [Candidatus Electrothrix sp. AU1_5]|nr:GNAT family N-acetyltransferase [Candidatus Electrothrix gigas]MCI5226428.1 GNAT family N-acetyltransferase [Candidatus Electrothrix gigas]
MNLRNITEKDNSRIRELIYICKPLGLHTSFTYWVLTKYFPNLCFLMESDKKLIGFISALRSTIDDKVLFIWQIAVSPEYRGKRYASILIKTVVDSGTNIGCNRFQLSISPKK